jgi:multidrug efflux pump subunit AcrB
MTTSQYFVYKRPIAWTLLIFTMIWGLYSYRKMPQRQDPMIQVRSGVVLTTYPGASAVEVEQEVSRKIEKVMSENSAVEHVRSISRQGQSSVFIDLYDTTKNAEQIWQDLNNRLEAINDLPTVAGQVLRPKLNKDFGDTVATMLTISSPPISDFEIEQRAVSIGRKIDEFRASRPENLRDRRYSGVLVFPSSVSPDFIERLGRSALQDLAEKGLIDDGQIVPILGAGVVDFRLRDGVDQAKVLAAIEVWELETIGAGLSHPDIWPGLLVQNTRDLADLMKKRVQEVPGGVARYTHEDLHKFADLIQDRLRQSPKVGKIEQLGVQQETVFLYFSNRRLAQLGIEPLSLAGQLGYRNINMPGGSVELPEQTINVKPSGPYRKEAEIGETVIEVRDGYPLYLRDLAEVVRGYEDPARMLNFRTVKSDVNHPPTALDAVMPEFGASLEAEHEKGSKPSGPTRLWTTRAVTLAVTHVKGTQIAEFGRDMDETLASLKGVLPDDIRVERTSDEPFEVHRKIDLFKDCLLEAVLIVIVVSLVFMEWRSALLVALSIPITVAMTLGFCAMLGIDIQQISIAALIIALGLLVDDPVVASDAINRELAHGVPRDVAAWLGPQKLSRAILFATLTNIVAFLPLLIVGGGAGEFIYSLPIVVTASLVASRIVSMTFIPLLAYYMLRGQKGLEAGLSDGGKGSRFARMYNGFSEFCMDHKWAALASCLVVLGSAMSLMSKIGTNFFPKDLHNAFTVNLFLPEGTPIRQTKAEAMRAIEAIDKLAGEEIDAYTTFVGSGGPRFWLSVVPEQPATNYSQILVHTKDAFATAKLAARLKRDLPPSFSAARVTVEQLESGPPIGIPVQLRLQGPELAVLRRLGDEVKALMRQSPGTENIHDDWDPQALQINLQVSTDRANMTGVTNQDVALMTNAGLSGYTATTIRERDRQVPVVIRLRPDERSRMEDMKTLQVFSRSGTQVPLEQVGTFTPEMVTPRIARRDNERCLTVKCDTVPGVLPSGVAETLVKQLAEVSKNWPPGYRYTFGGEMEEQAKGFGFMAVAMVASILGIYLALVLQFNSLTKPLLVFAAVPFGMVGGMMGLLIFNVPLGFFALLGLSSLAGVIISHVIVLFEYIEEAHERGETLHRAVIDAALVRLRPVLVTVLATVGGLVPLAMKGGPLWEPLCCVQIIGLLVATLVTKVVVPVLYILFVEDFKLIKWSAPGEHREEGPPAEYLSPTQVHAPAITPAVVA